MSKSISIKKVRYKLGLTQKEMGVLLGSNQQAVARIENKSRLETKQHKAHLIAVELIADNNLLHTLNENIIKKDIDNGTKKL